MEKYTTAALIAPKGMSADCARTGHLAFAGADIKGVVRPRHATVPAAAVIADRPIGARNATAFAPAAGILAWSPPH